MPLYEYQCEKCSQVFEVLQRFSDEPLKQHKECGGAVERLISRSALVFKGSGFYITDYAKGEGKTEAKADGKAESKSEVKSEVKSESKSETKSETKSESKSPDSSATTTTTKS